MTIYKVIKPYTSYNIRPPLTLPVGTIIEWWEERGFYINHAVNNTCVQIGKWAVESWSDYFEKVEEQE